MNPAKSHSYKYIGKKSIHWTHGEIYRVVYRWTGRLKPVIRLASNTDYNPIVWNVHNDGNWKAI